MNRQRLKHEAETVGAGSSVTRCLLDELHPGGQTEFAVDMGGWVCTVRGETKSGKISAIVERLSAGARGVALLEVPDPPDMQELRGPAGVAVRWLPRTGRPPGALLVPAAIEAAGRLAPAGVVRPVEDVDVDPHLLREVPDRGAALPMYSWLAGEAAAVTTLRRHLVSERGLDRTSVAFMGYWRTGRADVAAA